MNKDKFDGNYKDGVRKGFGVYTYISGARYEGEWEDDDKNGKGYFDIIEILIN